MSSNTPETTPVQSLTRQQLLDLERKKKTKAQLWLDMLIYLLPFVGGIVAVLEYTQVPDNSLSLSGFPVHPYRCLCGLLRGVPGVPEAGQPGCDRQAALPCAAVHRSVPAAGGV